MNKMTLADVQTRGKRVLVRCDFNVPLAGGRVTDDTRLVASLPTIRHLVEAGARVILCSHLGRPKGKPDPAYSLRPVAERLGALLGQEVRLAPDCVGPAVEAMARDLRDGEILLLENVRFHPEEEANDAGFAASLAALAALYVNDAFGSGHRAHASTEGITRHLSPSVAGFLMETELEHLGSLLSDPARPFVALLGGAKISGKLDVIGNLLGRVDRILVGGGMAFTFLKAKGFEVGRSLVEEDRLEVAARTLEDAARRRSAIDLPADVLVIESLETGDPGRVVPVDRIPANAIGVDIGPRTVEAFSAILDGARTVFWNGPMGIFEKAPYAKGTIAVAEAVARASDRGAATVVGGGDSAAAVAAAGVQGRITHISTGGGASLEFVEGKELPGVAALTDRPKR